MKKILITGATLLFVASGAYATEQKLSEQHLKVLDANNDGVVHESELKQFMQNAFKEIDKDADGVITWAEAMPALTREQFDMTDADKDGKLSAKEMETQAQADFRKADKDGDGRLN